VWQYQFFDWPTCLIKKTDNPTQETGVAIAVTLPDINPVSLLSWCFVLT